MTNKEAGEQLENLRGHCSNMLRHTFTDGEDIWGKDLEALDLAIKALEQEPCDDCISRQAVDTLIDELARAISDERCYLPQRGRDTGTIMQNILDLPPVTPQPKTGHWIKKEKEFIAPSRFYPIKEIVSTCSICDANYIGIHEDFKYCPNCGCRMEGVE